MRTRSFTFLDTAVVGVVAPFGKGAAGSCVECRKADLDPSACAGFGPGCLAPDRPPTKIGYVPGFLKFVSRR